MRQLARVGGRKWGTIRCPNGHTKMPPAFLRGGTKGLYYCPSNLRRKFSSIRELIPLRED